MNARMLFRHPHLIRGVVHTSGGSFVIERGLVRAPDEVGTAQGWELVRTDAAGTPTTPEAIHEPVPLNSRTRPSSRSRRPATSGPRPPSSTRVSRGRVPTLPP